MSAGAVVKQRSTFGDRAEIDGFPASKIGTLDGPPGRPSWCFHPGDLATLARQK